MGFLENFVNRGGFAMAVKVSNSVLRVASAYSSRGCVLFPELIPDRYATWMGALGKCRGAK